MKSAQIVRGIVVVLLLLSFVTACRDGEEVQSEPAPDRLAEIVIRGVLRVGISGSVPRAMQNNSGAWIGFDIDIASRLAEDLGVDVEFVSTSWSNIIPALIDENFDVIISGMEVRADRNLSVNFSLPYDFSGVSVVANLDRSPDLSTFDDFDDPRIAIAARKRSISAEAATRHFPKAELLLFDDESQALEALVEGRIDALLAETPNPAYYAADNPEILYLPRTGMLNPRPIAIALPKGDIDMLNFIDGWIRVVDAEGWLGERKAYWYKTKTWAESL